MQPQQLVTNQWCEVLARSSTRESWSVYHSALKKAALQRFGAFEVVGDAKVDVWCQSCPQRHTTNYPSPSPAAEASHPGCALSAQVSEGHHPGFQPRSNPLGYQGGSGPWVSRGPGVGGPRMKMKDVKHPGTNRCFIFVAVVYGLSLQFHYHAL